MGHPRNRVSRQDVLDVLAWWAQAIWLMQPGTVGDLNGQAESADACVSRGADGPVSALPGGVRVSAAQVTAATACRCSPPRLSGPSAPTC